MLSVAEVRSVDVLPKTQVCPLNGLNGYSSTIILVGCKLKTKLQLLSDSFFLFS